MQAHLPLALLARLDDGGQERHLPNVPGKNGLARVVQRPPLGGAQPAVERHARLRALHGRLVPCHRDWHHLCAASGTCGRQRATRAAAADSTCPRSRVALVPLIAVPCLVCCCTSPCKTLLGPLEAKVSAAIVRNHGCLVDTNECCAAVLPQFRSTKTMYWMPPNELHRHTHQHSAKQAQRGRRASPKPRSVECWRQARVAYARCPPRCHSAAHLNLTDHLEMRILVWAR